MAGLSGSREVYYDDFSEGLSTWRVEGDAGVLAEAWDRVRHCEQEVGKLYERWDGLDRKKPGAPAS